MKVKYEQLHLCKIRLTYSLLYLKIEHSQFTTGRSIYPLYGLELIQAIGNTQGMHAYERARSEGKRSNDVGACMDM